MNDQDRFFRELANRYSEADGQRLIKELWEQQNAPVFIPRLDAKVHRSIRARKTRNLTLALSTLAACLLLATIIIPAVMLFGAHNTSYGNTSLKATQRTGLIPLSFTLPQNFSVASAELDNRESVYRLTDTDNDNVVITLEKTDRAIDTENLIGTQINGKTIYIRQTEDYSLLTFKKDDVLYVLTCRYDLNTLITLGENIV